MHHSLHTHIPKAVVGVLAVTTLAGCGVKVDLNDANTGGEVTVGRFASFDEAKSMVRDACGIGSEPYFQPINLIPGPLPNAQIVYPFRCSDPEKDTQ